MLILYNGYLKTLNFKMELLNSYIKMELLNVYIKMKLLNGLLYNGIIK